MRMIDADTLKEKWTIASPEPYSTDTAEVLDSIEAAPTISAVPVVRCRECENYGKIGDCQSLDLLICIHSDTINNDFFPDPDFFCAYGQRKEAGHEQ